MEKSDPVPQGPTYTIRLNIDRERIEEEDTPLAAVKGYPNDLYAVQIYKKSIGNNYGKYAYGIFDNENHMSIELPAGAAYKIEMTLVPNGASLIARHEGGGYKEPFTVIGYGAGPGEVTNLFTTTFSTSMAKLNTGFATINESGTEIGYIRPPISRFYGIVEDFRPTENAQLTINLKWVIFGLTVIPEDFTEGHIEIKMESAPKLTITPDNPTAITQKIFTFDHSLSTTDWCGDDYSEDIPTEITWFKEDGTWEVLRHTSDPITFTRRSEKIIRLRLGAPDNNKVTISKEDEQLTSSEEEVIARP